MTHSSLPQPTSTFTIPSLHDDLELDCRLYYPRYRRPVSKDGHDQGSPDFFGRAFAIVAHPYASLGGSYDDGVVASIAGLLLREGVTVGTFNFRGAGGSPGHTSWTGRAEMGDYVSVYGFMACLIDAATVEMHGDGNGTPIAGEGQVVEKEEPLLILGGYSYGSLIASCLPSYEIVDTVFAAPEPGSTEAEIRSRADKAGQDLAAYFAMSRSGALGRGRASLRVSDAESLTKRNVAMGGYESAEAASRRISRDSSRISLDGERVRRSLDWTRHKLRGHVGSSVGAEANAAVSHSSPSLPIANGRSTNEGLKQPTITYLLVSPLLGSVSMATTMFSKPTFELKERKTGRVIVRDTKAKDEKFVDHSTCVVYGTKDVFTSEKKINRWAEELKARARDGRVMASKVEGAGHFWIEEGAMDRLVASVRQWMKELDR